MYLSLTSTKRQEKMTIWGFISSLHPACLRTSVYSWNCHDSLQIAFRLIYFIFVHPSVWLTITTSPKLYFCHSCTFDRRQNDSKGKNMDKLTLQIWWLYLEFYLQTSLYHQCLSILETGHCAHVWVKCTYHLYCMSVWQEDVVVREGSRRSVCVCVCMCMCRRVVCSAA